jgi:taurine dioxygenase
MSIDNNGSGAPNWHPIRHIESLGEVFSDGERLRKDLFTNHILIFRGLGRISVDDHIAMARLFGEPEQPLAESPLHPQNPLVEVLARDTQDKEYEVPIEVNAGVRKPSSFYWHADRSFLEHPSRATILRMITPARGGSINFLNTDIAFNRLDDADKILLRGAGALHSYSFYHAHLAGSGVYSPEETAAKKSRYPDVTHPLVVSHPVTGKEVPYISPLTMANIIPADNKINEAIDKITHNPTAFYSHDWQPDDVIAWDNYGVIHRSTPSTGKRELNRITVS